MRQRGILTIEQKDLLALARKAAEDGDPRRTGRNFVAMFAGVLEIRCGEAFSKEFADAIGMPHIYTGSQE